MMLCQPGYVLMPFMREEAMTSSSRRHVEIENILKTISHQRAKTNVKRSEWRLVTAIHKRALYKTFRQGGNEERKRQQMRDRLSLLNSAWLIEVQMKEEL